MSAFTVLTADALRDAARRRGWIAAAVASAIAGLAIARCGSCEAAVTLQGETMSAHGDQLGVVGAILGVALIALWTYAVSALLASDGLAAALEDGVALAVLARPVSRDTFVVARLAGAWLGACALGVALLALAVGIASDRPAITIAPALHAALAIAITTWSVAALAMTVSLSLPRAATLLALGALGATLVGSELASLLGAHAGGLLGASARYGPAWLAAPVAALTPWLGSAQLPGPPAWPDSRALVWAALVTTALVVRFRSLELPR